MFLDLVCVPATFCDRRKTSADFHLLSADLAKLFTTGNMKVTAVAAVASLGMASAFVAPSAFRLSTTSLNKVSFIEKKSEKRGTGTTAALLVLLLLLVTAPGMLVCCISNSSFVVYKQGWRGLHGGSIGWNALGSHVANSTRRDCCGCVQIAFILSLWDMFT